MSKFTLDKLKGELQIILLDILFNTASNFLMITSPIITNTQTHLILTPGAGKSKPQHAVPSFRFHKEGDLDQAEISEIPDPDTATAGHVAPTCPGHVFSLGESGVLS